MGTIDLKLGKGQYHRFVKQGDDDGSNRCNVIFLQEVGDFFDVYIGNVCSVLNAGTENERVELEKYFPIRKDKIIKGVTESDANLILNEWVDEYLKNGWVLEHSIINIDNKADDPKVVEERNKRLREEEKEREISILESMNVEYTNDNKKFKSTDDIEAIYEFIKLKYFNRNECLMKPLLLIPYVLVTSYNADGSFNYDIDSLPLQAYRGDVIKQNPRGLGEGREVIYDCPSIKEIVIKKCKELFERVDEIVI